MSMMGTFESFTETDIRQLLIRPSSAIRSVDPKPTWFEKDDLDVLISPITNILNKSLSLGVFSTSTKVVLVKPIIVNITVWAVIL